MKFLVIYFVAVSCYAAQCICQYPSVDSRYGNGKKKEILAYKAGCSVWLSKLRNCRSRSIVNINTPLSSVIKANISLVKLGFVGHWSNSQESVDFLKNEIRPIVENSNISFEVENTACRPMSNGREVQSFIEKISYTDNYITFKGSQTDSIGVWDSFSRLLRGADPLAYADSRTQLSYPKCKKLVKKLCFSKIIGNQRALCEQDHNLIKLKCKRSKVSKRLSYWRKEI